MKRIAFVAKSFVANIIIGSMLAAIALSVAIGQPVLYGGLGGRGVSSGPRASTNDGALVIVSQVDGSTTVVGHPAGVARIPGLAFGLDGTLFGTTQEPYGFPPPPGLQPSDLIRIDPDTGALISHVPIRADGVSLAISDLAVHPRTGALYGIRKFDEQVPTDGKLYIIDTTTGAAALVGDTGLFFASIAFAPDGTLYMSAATYDEQAGPVAPFTWLTLDPANAKILTSVVTSTFYHSLTVRPDGVIFGGTADAQGVYTINPATGAGTLIGMTSQKDLVGDLAFRPVAGPPAALDLNQHGLTGSWYEPVTSGQGIEVEVFPNLAGANTGVLQVSWFTYDHSAVGGAERQRWYTLGGSAATGAASAALTIYQNVGGNFNAPPITTAHPVGSATLSFTACDRGKLDYTFSDGTGRSGSIPLERLTQNVTCSTTSARPVNADFAFSGNWYDPATSGQGITVEINPRSPIAFFAWYTYARSGAAAGAAGQRWYTGESSYAAGARTLAMTLYETTGGLFDAPTTPPPNTVPVGTATLTFQSCTAATLSFSFTGGNNAGASGIIALTRVGPVPPGCAM
jgi:hypothetical protein